MILWGWLGAAGVMLALWAWQVKSRDASAVDVVWALATAALGATALALGDGDPARRWVLGILIAAWGLRLGLHLGIDRLWRAHGEDGRYAHWRAQAGPRWNATAFVFFQAQAVFVVLFALPALALAGDARPFGTWADWAGVTVWAVGQLTECTADRQLAVWRHDPANTGRTCRAGLWRWSRHPNYFGEWLQWCAWPLFALGSAWGAWLWLHPLLVLAFLVFVTGIPHTERRALASRGDDYRRYQRQTSAFIPWFPKDTP
jgi:steroid 5-alpha reductase family enzyme